MNINIYYEMCDDWGWFIDIENNNFSENTLLQPFRPRIKKFNSYSHKLPTIEEDDEYEYYKKIYKNSEENYDINLNPSNRNKENSINENGKINRNVFNIGSTTLITAVLTYIIFIIL